MLVIPPLDQQIHVRSRGCCHNRDLGQIPVDRYVEAWRTLLDAAKHQMRHGVKSDGAAPAGVARRSIEGFGMSRTDEKLPKATSLSREFRTRVSLRERFRERKT